MSLKIRMTRGGAKKAPYFRLVVTNSRSPRDSKFIEKVGAYDPQLDKTDAKRFTVNEERIKHWLSVGAVPSETVAKHFRKLGLIKTAPTYVIKAKGTGLKKKAADAAAAVTKAASDAAAAVTKAAADAAAAAAAPVEAPAEAAPAA